MPDGTKIPAEFLTHDQFLDSFRVPLRVPMDVDASCGKRWPEIGPDQGVGKPTKSPDEGVTDTEGVLAGGWSGVGIRKDKDTEGAILDTEASIDKQYFYGLDIGFEKDTTIMAEGHVENGELVIDRIIQPKPELGVLVGRANQGL
jgi:hypothetical protein